MTMTYSHNVRSSVAVTTRMKPGGAWSGRAGKLIEQSPNDRSHESVGDTAHSTALRIVG
jgi:hypothetical protein